MDDSARKKNLERMAALDEPTVPVPTHDIATGLLLPQFVAEAQSQCDQHIPQTYADRYVRCSRCNVTLAEPPADEPKEEVQA